ncbi:stage III sporulation protein AF [Paenibacillus sp. UNC499MF]|uniref:stage III sporulation protein AF n=1 Tax=Paenibacillus sp. UNC499MF TaxID=1502751 RepID=UPI00089FF915|nr:stage III sporulation protein AF [Paenibacillus sp. UNC499MF]SEG15601.1 stage III sporulation protein AF [Paenibacillus sp. UNC499MF]
MDWLGGWLKTVVALILLAAFIELMLPTNKMQRYVRTAMSLFILLTLLSPLLQLTRKSWDPARLLAEAQQGQQLGSAGAAGGRQAPAGVGPPGQPASLQAVMEQSDRLQAGSREQAVRLLEEKLAAEMRQTLQKETPYLIRDIRVKAAVDGQGAASVASVELTLDDAAPAAAAPDASSGALAGEAGASGMGPVKPVAPIASVAPVDVRIGGPSGPGDGAVAAQTGEQPTPAQRAAEEKLAKAAELGWKVDPSHISVQWTKEKSKL